MNIAKPNYPNRTTGECLCVCGAGCRAYVHNKTIASLFSSKERFNRNIYRHTGFFSFCYTIHSCTLKLCHVERTAENRLSPSVCLQFCFSRRWSESYFLSRSRKNNKNFNNRYLSKIDHDTEQRIKTNFVLYHIFSSGSFLIRNYQVAFFFEHCEVDRDEFWICLKYLTSKKCKNF